MLLVEDPDVLGVGGRLVRQHRAQGPIQGPNDSIFLRFNSTVFNRFSSI